LTEIEAATAMKEAEKDPFPEDFKVEIFFQLSRPIENRILQCILIIEISFKHKRE